MTRFPIPETTNVPTGRPTRRAWALGLLALTVLPGCDSGPTIPSAPPPPTSATLFFASRVGKGGEAWRSFQMTTTGEATVQLTSLIPQVESEVDLGLGTFDGTNCTITRQVAAKASAEAQIRETLAIGSYCVRIADAGNLNANNDFVITVVVPLPPPN
jgi:hypothetical protein